MLSIIRSSVGTLICLTRHLLIKGPAGASPPVTRAMNLHRLIEFTEALLKCHFHYIYSVTSLPLEFRELGILLTFFGIVTTVGSAVVTYEATKATASVKICSLRKNLACRGVKSLVFSSEQILTH